MTHGATPDDSGLLAEAIAERVLDHPAVVRLGGANLVTYLPGRRVPGVRVTGIGEPVELGVVLRISTKLAEIADELRTRVRSIVGDVRVDIEITDLEPDDEPSDPHGRPAGSSQTIVEGSSPSGMSQKGNRVR